MLAHQVNLSADSEEVLGISPEILPKSPRHTAAKMKFDRQLPLKPGSVLGWPGAIGGGEDFATKRQTSSFTRWKLTTTFTHAHFAHPTHLQWYVAKAVLS